MKISFLMKNRFRFLLPFFFLFGFLPNKMWADYRLPELGEVAQRATFICLGKVMKKTTKPQSGTNVIIKASIKVEKVFKGKPSPGDEFEVKSLETNSKASSLLEDRIESFPGENSKVLLFLKGEKSPYVPVCARTSVFEIRQSGDLYPMARFSLGEVEEIFRGSGK